MAGEPVSFSAVGNGEGLTYTWNFGDGQTGAGASVTHIYASKGTYTATVTTSNTGGNVTASASATVAVSVATLGVNISSFTPANPQVSQAVAFSSVASGQGNLGYVWSFGDGSTATGSDPAHSYTAAGSYVVTLTVTDSSGAQGFAGTTVVVTQGQATTPTPTAQLSSFSPAHPLAGQGISFTGSGTGSGFLSYAWNFGDGTAAASGNAPSHSYAHSGTYIVTLTVTDQNNASQSAQGTITVAPQPGPSALAITPAPSTQAVSKAITFTASASGYSPLSYSWDFGDGQTGSSGTSASITHAYSATGTYTVTLTVTDPDNLQAKATATVSVVPASLSLMAGAVGGQGNVDGTGSTAAFNWPWGTAVDSGGNVYVADSSNNVIRKVSPSGAVTTLAGTAEVYGSADGTGSSAQFAHPVGIAMDTSGNVYVTDSRNNTIRKISPAGIVTTLAGTAYASFNNSTGSNSCQDVDGAGAAARFCNPQGIAIDGAGNLYVADVSNQALRKITQAGVVTTLASSITASSVAVDGSDNLYVASGNALVQVSPAGIRTVIAGSSTAGSADGTGTAALFNMPTGLTRDSAGNLYVVDTGNSTLRKVTPAGVVTTLAGTAYTFPGTNSCQFTDGSGVAARFCSPEGISIDSQGNFYIGDGANSTIRKVTPTGVVTTLAGSAPAASAGKVDGNGAQARFSYPKGLATDASGNVYVADSLNGIIRKISPAGAVSTLAGSTGAWNSVAVDGSGNVYLADSSNGVIKEISSSGTVTTLAGTAGTTGSADGSGAAARFAFPQGVAVDGNGIVYVADSSNNTIRKIAPGGVVTTLAGTAYASSGTSACQYVDGTGPAARFCNPVGVAVDSSGNVYVTDAFNQVVRKVTPSGVVTTLAGGTYGWMDANGFPNCQYADGTGTAARFCEMGVGISVGSNGNIYVADVGNDVIRQITPTGVVTTAVGTPGQAGVELGGLPGILAWPAGVAVLPSGELVISTQSTVLTTMGI